MPDEALTTPGTAMGTVAYMSPEQARGEEIDARTDLFSFGAVLYEMATRKTAFVGNTTELIFNAILNLAPIQPISLIPEIPPKLDEIIMRLLENMRYQSAADLHSELMRLKRDADSHRSAAITAATQTTTVANPAGAEMVPGAFGTRAAMPTNLAASQRRWLSIALGLALVVGAAALVFLFGPALSPPKITGSTQVTKDSRTKSRMVTDGSRIYFSAVGVGNTLYQVSMVGDDTVPIETLIRGPVVSDISPDRSELLIASCIATLYQQECPVWILPVLGRSPQPLGNIRAADATWSRDGKEVVYVQGSTLYRVKINGTDSRKIVAVPVEVPLRRVGHRTETVCGSVCTPEIAAPHFGKSPRTEKIFTSCFPGGTTQAPSVAVIGRLMAGILFSNHRGVEPRIFGPSENRARFSEKPAINRFS